MDSWYLVGTCSDFPKLQKDDTYHRSVDAKLEALGSLVLSLQAWKRFC